MHLLQRIKGGPFGAIFLLFIATAVVVPAARAAGPQQPAQASATNSQFVGSDTCKTCHEDIYKGFEASPHWKTTLKTSTGEGHGCESCHGPGAAHVEGGGDKSKIFVFEDVSPDKVNKVCLQCHQFSHEQGNFQRSAHAESGMSCISCHSPHHARERQALLIQKQPLLCYTCHGEVKADFSKPFHHRVNEGLVNCTDCHNVHGSFVQQRMLRATAGQDQVCYRCHVDKQGPWVFNHFPVNTAGCTACHMPHGSMTPRLLKVGQVNFLCLQCHTPSAAPNTRAGDSITAPPIGPGHQQSQKYVSCTLCHVAIHGSNADPAFLK